MADFSAPLTDDSASPSAGASAKKTAGVRWSRIFWWFLAGFVAVSILALLRYLPDLIGDSVPELTPATYDAAWEKWKRMEPANYGVEIEVSGRQAAVYRVEVRQGEVVSASHNGTPLPNRRTWFTWSVPGMFETIERDLRPSWESETRSNSPGEAGPKRLTLRAEFDATYGYPTRYQRFEWGAAVDAQWQVLEFRPKLENAPDNG